MNKNNFYNIFYELKNKNISQSRIIELLAIATKTEKDITKITQYEKNLLIFSCLHDNDNLFSFLAEQFNQEFKDSFLNCIKITYTNKNPIILNKAFEYIPKLNEEEKTELTNLFSNNCYRIENIETTQKWCSKNLNQIQLDSFVENLFKNNNTPYLSRISSLSFWKPYIENCQYAKTNIDKSFFERLIKEPIKENNIYIGETFEISPNSINIKQSEEPNISKRRRKFVTPQRANVN